MSATAEYKLWADVVLLLGIFVLPAAGFLLGYWRRSFFRVVLPLSLAVAAMVLVVAYLRAQAATRANVAEFYKPTATALSYGDQIIYGTRSDDGHEIRWDLPNGRTFTVGVPDTPWYRSMHFRMNLPSTIFKAILVVAAGSIGFGSGRAAGWIRRRGSRTP